MKKDIIIIGGGASGMMCAIKAKEKNPEKSVVILEKQSRIGRKLLSTGNGRCNLSNSDANNTEHYHGSFKNNLKTVFKECLFLKTLEQFPIALDLDSEGRYYPFSNHAGTVLDILRFRLEELGVEIYCDTLVKSIIKKDELFFISTDDKEFSCKKLVIATGSPASPKLGADKSGLDLLRKLGHKITPLHPALCPLEVAESKIMPSIKGVRQKGIASLYDGNELIKTESGEIQFTENALSGICIFNLSSFAKDLKNPIVSLNLNYDKDNYGQLLYVLKLNKERFKKREISRFLDVFYVNKLGIAIIKSAGIKNINRPVSTLSKDEIENICDTIYDWRFKVKLSSDFNKAQVCSGGVSGDEINPKTMESKVVENLYICGEAVDINGDCGGFNLNFAFSSGIIAGENL